jgi:putative FmdB family regulatory protein
MPTYEYGCEACGKTWELEQRITEAAIKECPACGKPEARRLISGGTFMLKGGGWYADGYGSKKPAAKSEGKPEGKSEGKPEGKSEGKPEGKPDAGSSGGEGGAKSAPSSTASGAADS